VVYNFPAAYGNTATGTWGFEVSIPGSDLGLPVNDVLVTYTATDWDTIDGWGKTVTPLGAYPSLRNKRKEYSRTVIGYRLLPFGNYTTQSDTRDTTIRYSYHAKESKGALVTLEYDSLDNLKDVIYSMVPPPAPTVAFSDANMGGGLVDFTSNVSGYHDTYSWNFGDGTATSSQQNPSHAYTANGAYYVCLTVYNGTVSTTYCDSVHITDIATGGTNNAPVAINDYDTIVQATNTILHVAGNDVDADGDNICVTSVWGSQYATEYIGGTCDMILFAPDSTFTGNDTCYYSLCDDGNPVLCDTGMVVFTVTPDAGLLPVADFEIPAYPDLFMCEGGPIYSIHDMYTAVNTSINSDSVIWTFRVADIGNCTDSSKSYYGDTLDFVFTSAINSNCLFFEMELCITAVNAYGTNTKCDTACHLLWESIDETTLSNISIYPNPTSNVVTMDMSNNQDAITNNYSAIEVYNVLGKKQALYTGGSKVASLNIADLAAGMYTATIVGSNGERRALGRFVKE
ncbi:MAG: T9SS type A sorting domain-containing protein, partial [Bacteroidetes bacterium]|nr:T9SS type A sorting domain-containing protein [Bacteroidota bacterium]